MILSKKQNKILEDNIHKFVSKKEDFGNLSKIEQTKYLAYFLMKILNLKFFNTQDIAPLFISVGVYSPENIRDLLNKLKDKGILIPINNNFSFHRNALLKLDEEFNSISSSENIQMIPKTRISKLKILKMRPEIIEVSEKLFNDEHYAQAIEEAFKKIILLVKQKSGKEHLDGCGLMTTVFSKNNPILKFNQLRNRTEQDEQEGWMHLYVGAVLGIRDVKAHGNIIQKDPIKTLEYLSFASLLCRRLDETTK